MRIDDLCRGLSEKRYYVFSLEDLAVFFPEEKKGVLRQYLSRWKKGGYVASLRRGLYELLYPVPPTLSDMYLANKIYSPSYVSLETALSHYSMIPEVSMAVLSVAPKPTRRFKNHGGLFIYRSIQPKAFCGYHIEKHRGFDVLIAEPEKALADFLYFKSLRSGKLDAEALRLDRKRVRRLNRKKLGQYGRLYGLRMKGILDACL